MNAYDKHKAKFTVEQIQAARNFATASGKSNIAARDAAKWARLSAELAASKAKKEREEREAAEAWEAGREEREEAARQERLAYSEQMKAAMERRKELDYAAKLKLENAIRYYYHNPVEWVKATYAARVNFQPNRKHSNLEQLVRDQYGLPRVTWSVKLISGAVQFEELEPENRRGAVVALHNMIQTPEVEALRLLIDGKPQSLFNGGACPWMGGAVIEED